ncbi:MAG: ferredoxin, partial [Candidatus Rokubacteria bacterium]|nr:ferredoxin [Candidatus Rokubacteria bacterium]
SPSHLLAGVLRGLQSRHPTVFSLHCPCPPEHGLADEAAPNAAKLSLESRAFPLLVYDPAAGPSMADRLSLDGNPSIDEPQPAYTLTYVDDGGAEQTMELPVTVADWAATESRFRKHFTRITGDAGDEELVPLHEYLPLAPDDRAGKRPFIYTLESGRRLGRLAVDAEVVRLAEDRRAVWNLLREMAGLKAPEALAAEAELEQKLAALRAEYEAKLADLKARYPWAIARRLAEGLLKAGDGSEALAGLLEKAGTLPGAPSPGGNGGAVLARPAAPAPAVAAASVATAPAPAVAAAPAARDEALAMEPYIDGALCTACNECTNLNKRLFAYNAKKQANIKDPRAGTFKELVQAAEKCPVKIIHPGTPLNPKEKDLAKWIQRATPFN